MSSAPPAVLLCFHRKTKARRPSLTFHWRLETRPIIGRSEAVCSHREDTCCHSRDEFLSGLSAIVSSGVWGRGGGLPGKVEGLPEPGGLRQAGEKVARPAGQRPGPQWAVLGRLQTATTAELPCSSVCARGHLRPFSSTSFSQTCPHTDSHAGSGVNTDPSTDKPPDGGSPSPNAPSGFHALGGTVGCSQFEVCFQEAQYPQRVCIN